MAVTIVGSLSIATAGQDEVRTVLIGALGCNIAWGLVDAVMYVVRTATERARLRELGVRIRSADASYSLRARSPSACSTSRACCATCPT
jgi:hypothetical protein